MSEIEFAIRLVTPEIQELVDLVFAKLSGEPEPGTALEQVNLKGGDTIVYEFLEHGEFGLAFDHLTYMVEVTGIELTTETRESFAKILALLR